MSRPSKQFKLCCKLARCGKKYHKLLTMGVSCCLSVCWCAVNRIMFKQVEASGSRVSMAKKDKVRSGVVCGCSRRRSFRHQRSLSCSLLYVLLCVQGKPITLLSLEGFSELLHVVVSRQRVMQSHSKRSSKSEPMDLSTFLSNVSSTGGTQTLLPERIHHFIRTLQVPLLQHFTLK